MAERLDDGCSPRGRFKRDHDLVGREERVHGPLAGTARIRPPSLSILGLPPWRCSGCCVGHARAAARHNARSLAIVCAPRRHFALSEGGAIIRQSSGSGHGRCAQGSEERRCSSALPSTDRWPDVEGKEFNWEGTKLMVSTYQAINLCRVWARGRADKTRTTARAAGRPAQIAGSSAPAGVAIACT